MWQKFFNVSFLIDTSGLLRFSVASLCLWFNELCGPQLALKGLCGDLNIQSPYFEEL